MYIRVYEECVNSIICVQGEGGERERESVCVSLFLILVCI